MNFSSSIVTPMSRHCHHSVRHSSHLAKLELARDVALGSIDTGARLFDRVADRAGISGHVRLPFETVREGEVKRRAQAIKWDR